MKKVSLAILTLSMLISVAALTAGFHHQVAPNSSVPVLGFLLSCLFWSFAEHWGMWAVLLLAYIRPSLLYPWSLILALANINRLFKMFMNISINIESVINADTFAYACLVTHMAFFITFIITHLVLVYRAAQD